MVYDYEPFEGGEEVEGFASIAVKVFWWFSFQSRASSSVVSIPIFMILSAGVAIGVRRVSSSLMGSVRTEGVIIVVLISETVVP